MVAGRRRRGRRRGRRRAVAGVVAVDAMDATGVAATEATDEAGWTTCTASSPSSRCPRCPTGTAAAVTDAVGVVPVVPLAAMLDVHGGAVRARGEVLDVGGVEPWLASCPCPRCPRRAQGRRGATTARRATGRRRAGARVAPRCPTGVVTTETTREVGDEGAEGISLGVVVVLEGAGAVAGRQARPRGVVREDGLEILVGDVGAVTWARWKVAMSSPPSTRGATAAPTCPRTWGSQIAATIGPAGPRPGTSRAPTGGRA
jgi:hypothetical protein